MLRILLVVIALGVLTIGCATADGIKTPAEQFAGYPTLIEDIPDGWATTNPVFTRVCFKLKYPINSAEADAFLHELHSTISSLEFAPVVRIERAIYPESHPYCLSMTFRNWEHNRSYESDAVFLRFYHERWKSAITDMQEQLSVLDEAAAGND